MAENEDIDYTVSDHATPEPERQSDEDQPNKSVLLEIQKYLNEAIAKHSSIEVINPNAEAVMSTQQQIVVHKEVVAHLQNIKTSVDNKIKELL